MYPNKLYQTSVFVTTTIYKIICIKYIILSVVKKRARNGLKKSQGLGQKKIKKRAKVGHILVKNRSKKYWTNLNK